MTTGSAKVNINTNDTQDQFQSIVKELETSLLAKTYLELKLI